MRRLLFLVDVRFLCFLRRSIIKRQPTPTSPLSLALQSSLCCNSKSNTNSSLDYPHSRYHLAFLQRTAANNNNNDKMTSFLTVLQCRFLVIVVVLLQLRDASSFLLSCPTMMVLHHPAPAATRRTVTTTTTTMLHQTKNNHHPHHHHHHPTNDNGLLVSSMANAAATATAVAAPTSSPLLSSPPLSLPLSPSLHQLTPLEVWCTSQMEDWYSQSLLIKCPFFRRRMADLLDHVDMVMRFLIIRHKSLDIIGPPPGCRALVTSNSKRLVLPKLVGATPNQVLELIRNDWRGGGVSKSKSSHSSPAKTNQNKQLQQTCGYYITGRLNTAIYRDDCWFDGPDPDMPVRGVRKYVNAASQLFDHKTSTAELLDLQLGPSSSSTTGTTTSSTTTIVATWRLSGVLHLPWKPKLPTWTGTTTYHLDQDGAFLVLLIICLFGCLGASFGCLLASRHVYV